MGIPPLYPLRAHRSPADTLPRTVSVGLVRVACAPPQSWSRSIGARPGPAGSACAQDTVLSRRVTIAPQYYRAALLSR